MRNISARGCFRDFSVYASFLCIFSLAKIPVADALSSSLDTSITQKPIAEELKEDHIQSVNELVSAALGDNNESGTKLVRYDGARTLADNLQRLHSHDQSASTSGIVDDAAGTAPPRHELVYGELSIPVLATILDAVGVKPGDRFMDIGSGDGALVLGACLLYPDHISRSRGVELVPGLVARSKQHLRNMEGIFNNSANPASSASILQRIEFSAGDVYEPTYGLCAALKDSTLVVCFATTWSSLNNQENHSKTSLGGRRLPKLSMALKVLPQEARVVIVDGKLDEKDGFRWEGDLRVTCPDTAPYSTASLYSRC